MLSTKAGYRYIADIFLPNRCALCGRVIVWDRLICTDCGNDLPETFEGSLAIGNTVCAVGVFYYGGNISKLIYGLKHGRAVFNFAELGAEMIAERLRKRGIADKIDIVTCVPMHRSKVIARGRDQAAVIAKFTADKLGKPTDLRLLRRSKDKTEQHKLSEKSERTAHAQAVYCAAKGHADISGKTVLICDDVITTGSTVSACAALLLSMGAEKVYAGSIAVSEYYKEYENKEYIEV